MREYKLNYIRITKENVDKEHICCAMSNKQSNEKKKWLKPRFEEGLVFYRSEERGKCFIEYLPAENAWVPIEADRYLYTLELKKGDSLQVHFETSSGSARMMVAAQNGTSIYSGNGTATTDFTLEIPESGTYTVIVEAQHAKGIIDIRLREGRK